MSYLINSDYNRFIQDVSLSQVISGNEYFKTTGEIAAKKEITGYLSQRYDIAKEFTDTVLYDPIKIYKAADRVYIDAPAYNAASTYALKALTLQAGKIYQCSTAITVIEPFTVGHWTLLGSQYDIFYCQYPFTLFDINKFYKVGDKIFWKDKKYTCLSQSIVYTHDTLLQFANTNNIPFQNYLPDDPINGPAQWHDDGAYSVAAGSLLDTTKFTFGDNRDALMVMDVAAVNIYHLYGRLNKEMPTKVADNYTATIARLRMIAKGDVTTELNKIQPNQGARIRNGSNIKNINTY